MREVLMSAGTITTIVLFVVGVFKLPFKGFKEKHPSLYKATFFMLSLVLAIALPIISELFIIGGKILTFEFLVHILVTLSGVFVGYSGYEGIGLKKLCNYTVATIKQNMNTYSDTKVAKFLDKVGFDRIVAIKEAEEKKAVEETQKLAENNVVEKNEIK